MIEKHLPYYVRDYNMKVEYLSKTGGATFNLPISDVNEFLQSYTQSPTANYPTVTPRTSVQQLNDRKIAAASISSGVNLMALNICFESSMLIYFETGNSKILIDCCR